MNRYNNILVGVDTETGEMVLRRAIAMARRNEATLHVAHSVYVPPSWWGAAPAIGADIAALQEASSDSLWAQIDELLATEPGVTVTKHRVEGFPPDAIIDLADEVAADLIVLGTHGRGEISAFLLGSTGHRVLAHANADVLIVKQGL